MLWLSWNKVTCVHTKDHTTLSASGTRQFRAGGGLPAPTAHSLDYTHPLTSGCLTRHNRLYFINTNQGDRERRKSNRSFSPLDPLLWLVWRLIKALNWVGRNFGYSSSSNGLFDTSTSARRDVWVTVLLLSPLSQNKHANEKDIKNMNKLMTRVNTLSKAASVQSSIVDYLKKQNWWANHMNVDIAG